MKKIFTVIACASLFALVSCDLDLYPVTEYNEGNVKVEGSSGTAQYSTRADMEGLRQSMYDDWVKSIQEMGFNDWLIMTECRCDNAYCGTNTTEIEVIEANKVDADNYNLERDWKWHLEQVSNTNNIICYIDDIMKNDPTLTQAEHDQWKAEALCWRAWNWLKMAYIWKDVPLVMSIPPAITAENIEEVYSEYYPSRAPIDTVYSQIIKDMEYAVKYAPDRGEDKMVFTKAFAHGILARLYAEKTCRDWSKVDEHCKAIEDMGYKLCDSYDEMWAYNDVDANRNTSESIFEVRWTRANGNWDFMMFHRNAYDPDDSFSWAKWVTPSRNIIAAYDAEGDTERKNASIVYDACTWSNYYPSNNYAFMHKLRTNASSIIVMRLAEIYLLHAEALCGKKDFSGATEYVNKVRRRAKLSEISVPASEDAMIEAILKERRLELSFEGFRFHDLVRYDKAAEVHDAMNAEDPYWKQRNPLTEETILMPVPQSEIDNNPNITQNPGY